MEIKDRKKKVKIWKSYSYLITKYKTSTIVLIRMYLEKEFRRTISEKNMEKKKLYENVFPIFDEYFYIRNSQCCIML